mmetsp:Transcript_23304/g.33902  ORF Transcript_23304/g.33902 Transcript_23304/m.33902 type:complete len:81 (-) Transcript_23304:196-438(-)
MYRWGAAQTNDQNDSLIADDGTDARGSISDVIDRLDSEPEPVFLKNVHGQLCVDDGEDDDSRNITTPKRILDYDMQRKEK